MNRIVELRIDNDYTQVELAKKLNIPRGSYVHFETGEVKIGIELLNKLANIYNVSSDYIMCLTDEDSPSKFNKQYKSKTRAKNLRISKKIKQSDIANQLKMSQNGYSDYETEKTKIPVDILLDLCKYYKVSLDYMLYRTDVPNPYPKSKKYVV